MRSPTLRRTGLPMLLALLAVASVPFNALGGETAVVAAANARRAAVTPASNPVSYGSDGRLTLLLLGSDYRDTLYGERTDVIMVVSIDPGSGKVAMANIPRDMVDIPRAPSNGTGTSGPNRINSLYYHYRPSGLKHKSNPYLPALQKFKADVATLLQTEIDYVAMVRFDGFDKLMTAIGGVNVTITAAIRDDFYKAPGEYSPVRGVYFPARTIHLLGNVNCNPYPHWCHNGLAYARSRHGFVGSGYNTDFARAHRQQGLLQVGAQKIVTLGTGNLSSLLSAAKVPTITTDLPRTLDAATQLYNLANGATAATRDRVVFSPNKWAYADSTTPLYAFRPRLGAIRTWINQHFGS